MAKVPQAGDIVWLNFDPQVGHEQAGHRPAIVISEGDYNQRLGLMVCAPMTSQIKGYPFEVLIAGPTPSVVLADQVKSFDWKGRKAKHKGRVTDAELAQVRQMAAFVLGITAP